MEVGQAILFALGITAGGSFLGLLLFAICIVILDLIDKLPG